jgi:hypothetical protein
VGKHLHAKDLGVRKEIKEFIDVIKSIAKQMLEAPGCFTVSMIMTAEMTVLQFPNHHIPHFLYSDI